MTLMTESPKVADVSEEKKTPRVYNPFTLYKGYRQKKAQAKKEAEDLKKQNALFVKFRLLYTLVMNIDKQLPNRHAKKQYWRNFIMNKGQVQKKLFLNIMNNANPDRDCYLVNKYDLQLDKISMRAVLKAKGVDVVKIDVFVELLNLLRITDIVKDV